MGHLKVTNRLACSILGGEDEPTENGVAQLYFLANGCCSFWFGVLTLPIESSTILAQTARVQFDDGRRGDVVWRRSHPGADKLLVEFVGVSDLISVS